MEYRFLGTETEIGGRIRLDQLGQKVQLGEQEALDAMKGGCVIISSAEYEKLGFTAEEEKLYKWPGARAAAPEEFKAKLFKGFATYRKALDEAAMGISASAVPVVLAVIPPKPAQIPAAPPIEEKN